MKKEDYLKDLEDTVRGAIDQARMTTLTESEIAAQLEKTLREYFSTRVMPR